MGNVGELSSRKRSRGPRTQQQTKQGALAGPLCFYGTKVNVFLHLHSTPSAELLVLMPSGIQEPWLKEAPAQSSLRPHSEKGEKGPSSDTLLLLSHGPEVVT